MFFENAGHTVEFYVREGRKAQYSSYVNLELWDARQSKKDRIVKEKWPIVMYEEIKENHDYDLIFMSVNPEQVSSAVKYLAPRVGNATVLFFSNFWQDPRLAVQPIPRSQIVYDFPGAGGGFEGNTLYGGAGFKIMVQKDVKSWLWNHFAFNATTEVEVLKSGSFEKVISSREALDGLGRNLKEMIPVLKTKGSKLDFLTKVLSGLPPKVVSFLMSHVVFSPKSMSYALVAHNHFKVGYAVQEVITDARKYGIKAPRLYDVESLITDQ